jgi:hypothetical protein
MLVFCLAYYSTLKMEATYPSEMSVDFNSLHDFTSQKTVLFMVVMLYRHAAVSNRGMTVPKALTIGLLFILKTLLVSQNFRY